MLLLALAVAPALAVLPLPVQPDCGEPDRPDLCPADLQEEWTLLSYFPAGWSGDVPEDQRPLGPGMWVDRAWRTTTGRADVVIAVLDSGIEWDEPDLRRKIALNVAELPLPAGASSYDADGDGVVTVDDWAGDPRVALDAGVDVADGVLDASDLIAAFSDGVDDDGNAFVDDIAGWDFLWNDNDPYDDTRDGHGTGMARRAAAEGGDGDDDVGACPNCRILPVRVGDAFVADGAAFGTGLLFAVDAGAAVVLDALGALNHSTHVREAIDHAWDQGVAVIASAGDETAWHPNPPGSEHHTVYLHALRHGGHDADEADTFLAYANCSNHGLRLDLSASSPDCSSEATGAAAGIAGLVVSAARDAGLSLSAAEVWQLLVGASDDVDVPGDDVYPSGPGWDPWFGHGRMNAARAVEAVTTGAIPPVADLLTPAWYGFVPPGTVVDVVGVVAAPRSAVAGWTLEVGIGLEPTAWETVATGTSAVDGTLASWTVPDPGAVLEDWDDGDDQVDRERAVEAAAVQLRLTVTDTAGRVGLARKAIHAVADPDLLPGWPLDLGSSLEASPRLVDLDGDGVLDVIQGDGAGRVHALRADGSALPGWPVRVGLVAEVDPDVPGHHRGAPAFQRVDPDIGEPVTATPAVGDLDGDGTLEVVVATLRGALWVFEADGSVRDGFPVRQDDVLETGPGRAWAEGFLSSPALGDLDGDGTLEIVVGGMDQRVYAWRHDGTAADGWPVRVTWPGYEDEGARIVSSPAIGDLDRDGRDDVVIGSNETLDGQHAALYALSGDGSALPGWPVWLYSLQSDVLPVVGEGFPGAAALGDLDGDGVLEVVAHGLAGELAVLTAEGEEALLLPTARGSYGAESNANDATALPLMNSPTLGDADGDGVLDVFTGAAGIGYMMGMQDGGTRTAFDHFLGGWSGATGDFLPGFPRVVEDLQFFQNPPLADLDGDGRMEAMTASGGFVVHAWNADGEAPAGWPKLAGQWVVASPTVGDIDGDGLLEVVVATRGGLLFAWRTPSPAGADVAWAGFGHDPANTHNAEKALPAGYNAGYPVPTGEEDGTPDGCGCANAGAPGTLASWAGLGLVVGAIAGARRRRAG